MKGFFLAEPVSAVCVERRCQADILSGPLQVLQIRLSGRDRIQPQLICFHIFFFKMRCPGPEYLAQGSIDPEFLQKLPDGKRPLHLLSGGIQLIDSTPQEEQGRDRRFCDPLPVNDLLMVPVPEDVVKNQVKVRRTYHAKIRIRTSRAKQLREFFRIFTAVLRVVQDPVQKQPEGFPDRRSIRLKTLRKAFCLKERIHDGSVFLQIAFQKRHRCFAGGHLSVLCYLPFMHAEKMQLCFLAKRTLHDIF